MSRIYTRRGDDSTTGIRGGRRVPKHDIRIEANGWLDTLNVEIGALRTLITNTEENDLLRDIQLALMDVMSLVATPSELIDTNPAKVPKEIITRIETRIDILNAGDTPRHFILPGGTPETVAADRARVAARTAERRISELMETEALPPQIPAFINRLSDLFFSIGRYYLLSSGRPEECWRTFAHNK